MGAVIEAAAQTFEAIACHGAESGQAWLDRAAELRGVAHAPDPMQAERGRIAGATFSLCQYLDEAGPCRDRQCVVCQLAARIRRGEFAKGGKDGE